MFSLEALFCHVDDFCKKFEGQWHKNLLKHGGIKRVRAKSLCLSEIMTIAITQCLAFGETAFHQNHYRNFKHFYIEHVQKQWRCEFPRLPSKRAICGMDAISSNPAMCILEGKYP
jgi:hypothetical protein